MSKSKRKVSKTISAKTYRIYGIYDFKKKSLIYVSLSKDQVELEFDLTGYDEELFGIVYSDILMN